MGYAIRMHRVRHIHSWSIVSTCIIMTMACDNAGPAKKKNMTLYCHFKSAWKSQEFTVTVGGAEKTVSGTILFGVEGNEISEKKMESFGSVERFLI